jgi:pantothenate kinase
MTEVSLIRTDYLIEKLLAAYGERTIVAIAGAPGSGKSTMAEAVVSGINARANGSASLLPMDGYHYDDLLLRELGRLHRKGAPDTFDVHGLDHMLSRLRALEEDAVAIPLFDRRIEISRAGARLIPRSSRLIVVEGNYLLLEHDPWRVLRKHFDVAVMVEVPEATLRERLIDRWRSLGLDESLVQRKVEENDLPNGRMVEANSARPDYRVLSF